MPEASLKVNHTTLRELALKNLRDAILTLRFRPGDRLVERELCELTGVSRSCIREALRSLESEGLVSIVPHRGPTVATLSIEEAEEIYEVRAVLEGFAGEKFACNASKEQIGALRRAQLAYGRAIRSKDVAAVLKTLSEFYWVLFAGAGNTVAASVIRTLQARMQYLRSTTTALHTQADTRQSIQNFKQIVACAERREAQATGLACQKQVRDASEVAVRILRRQLQR